MPLTQVSEQAANRIQALLDTFDRQLERYILDGGTPPNPDQLEQAVTEQVRRSMVSGLLEVDPDITDAEVDAMIAATVASILQAARSSARSATLIRAQLENAQPVDDDEGTSAAGLVRRYGPLVAFATLLAASRPRRRTDLERMARNTQFRMPARTSSYARMRIRTDTAIVRNVRASQVVERQNAAEGNLGWQTGDWVLKVEDARLGPTDLPCEEVSGQLATPTWARAHPIEHPNCTRRTRPYRLREGDVVTLLS